MKLFDATLDLASFAKGTEDYTVSEVTGNKLTCNDLSGRVGEFGGGTIWVRTGESAGYFGRIQDAAAQTIWLPEEIDIAPGDEITIGSWLEFDTQKLINAVNSVLRMYKIMKVDETLRFDPEKNDYELPEGVTEDVRGVQIETCYFSPFRQSVTVPGMSWIDSHYWRVENGWLVLYDRHKMRYKNDGVIRISYVDYHGSVGKDDTISGQVDPLYLRYMSWLYLCRNLIQQTHKDNLVSTDMYNEAKIYERDYGNLPNKRLRLRVITFPQW